jgi:ABC-type Fe3+ transport system substrate-binding protein
MDLIKKIKHLFNRNDSTNSLIRRIKLNKIYNKSIDVIYTDSNIDFKKIKEIYKL